MKKLILFFFFLISFLPQGNSHKFYTSITQIEYNNKTQSYEIIMNVFWDDWEHALSELFQKQIRIDKQGIEEYSMEYLESSLVFKLKEKKMKYKMVGVEQDKDILKIYLELPHKYEPKGLMLKNDCLLREFDGQINIVNFIHSAERKTYIFKSISQFQEIK